MNDKTFFFMILGILVAMVFLSWRQQSRDRKSHAQMLENIKKGDRVVTIGGIIATVAATRESDLVLKIDDSNNIRVRVLRSAIHEVITSREGASGDGSTESRQ